TTALRIAVTASLDRQTALLGDLQAGPECGINAEGPFLRRRHLDKRVEPLGVVLHGIDEGNLAILADDAQDAIPEQHVDDLPPLLRIEFHAQEPVDVVGAQPGRLAEESISTSSARGRTSRISRSMS